VSSAARPSDHGVRELPGAGVSFGGLGISVGASAGGGTGRRTAGRVAGRPAGFAVAGAGVATRPGAAAAAGFAVWVGRAAGRVERALRGRTEAVGADLAERGRRADTAATPAGAVAWRGSRAASGAALVTGPAAATDCATGAGATGTAAGAGAASRSGRSVRGST
jgi:hypothetical protein